MRFRGWKFVLVLAVCSGCFHLPRSFHTLSYRNQRVFIDRHHSFAVGKLSDQWERLPKKGPGIIFKHRGTAATLATEALCGAAYEDLPLKMLTDHLLVGLKNVTRQKEELWTLSGREALYTQTEASLDGVTVSLKTLVIKKNRCQFDFMAVSPPGHAKETARDFEQFTRGFDYE